MSEKRQEASNPDNRPEIERRIIGFGGRFPAVDQSPLGGKQRKEHSNDEYHQPTYSR